jgi:hypothetical protein
MVFARIGQVYMLNMVCLDPSPTTAVLVDHWMSSINRKIANCSKNTGYPQDWGQVAEVLDSAEQCRSGRGLNSGAQVPLWSRIRRAAGQQSMAFTSEVCSCFMILCNCLKINALIQLFVCV